MTELSQQSCTPCRGGVEPLRGAALQEHADQLEGWEVVENHHLERLFSFPDFATALAFVNQVGRLAEDQGHHPDLLLSWGKVIVRIWTHKIDGLHANDFILAAKIDQL
jgi:4a-hydroxytetrahydrobiopterin dehydratase